MLVKIDEPHMYNADDAVARIDSYIVSVTGGGRFVGERKLVRIEEVERAAAIASLLGGESPNGSANGAENGAELDSDAPARKRSRGRRGGRGRSRAKQGGRGRDDSMYAVVESGGKQYKVEEGTSLLVDRLDAKEGDKVALRPVIFRDGDVIVGAERAGESQSRGESRRAPARPEDQSLQIQGEEGLPAHAPGTAPS